MEPTAPGTEGDDLDPNKLYRSTQPAAPGTEDEEPTELKGLNKKDKETARLLQQKAYLKDGRYDTVFHRTFFKGNENWFCKACECPIKGPIYQHELGRRHVQTIATLSAKINKVRYDGPNKAVASEAEPIELAPGEPVPPGYEGEVSRRAQIQDRLDAFKVGPLVALEYLVEMIDLYPSREPLYLCVLCDKRGDPRTVLTHLTSYNHISQYLQKHFPTCFRAMAPFMTRLYKHNWQPLLQKIAEAIEEKFGRLRPFSVEQHKFERDRMHYLSMISTGPHFSEQSGHTFVELVNVQELIKELTEVDCFQPPNPQQRPVEAAPKHRSTSPPGVERPKRSRSPVRDFRRRPRPGSRRRSLSSISSISSDDEGAGRSKRGARNRSPPAFQRLNRTRPRRSPSPPRRKFPREDDEERRRNKEKEKLQKIDDYNKLSKAIDADVEKTLKSHEKNPEKHPKYNEEWKLFWNRRYKELQADGKDASKYDFKPEWIGFWSKRMKELSIEELKNRKDALRKRLGLGDEPTPISFRIGPAPPMKPKPMSTKPNAPMAARPDNDPEIIILDDKTPEREIEPRSNQKRSDSKRERSYSPWESDVSPPRNSGKDRKLSRSPSPAKRRRRSKDRSVERRRRSSRDRRSRSRDSYKSSSYFRESRDRDVDLKKFSSRDKSWERGVRESSFERDVRGRDRIRTVAELPWERQKYDYYAPPAVMREARPSLNYVPPAEDDKDDGQVNIVSVLRLLTALEEKLGSLGPKIIDLLAQALAMEKNEANSSDSLLDNEINCVMFETVKEKLKGQLLAGLVDSIQERAFKKAIQKTAGLIHIAGQRKHKASKDAAVAVPGVGSVDKAAIAKQLAAALVAQGKTDVTQAELEQLINAVVGMAEASKNSNKPVTAASFLAQLTGGSNKTSTGDKVIIPRVGRSDNLDSMTEPLSPSTPERSATNNMENLSDSDLQTLLQNFKDLSAEEQINLINYLKKLEMDEPQRVERLRRYVRLTDKPKDVINLDEDDSPVRGGRRSPFSSRLDDLHAQTEKKKDDKIHLDSEDEDYSYEDVVKAASKNVKDKELEAKKDNIAVSLSDAKSIISNLMGSLGATSSSSNVNLLGLPSGSTPTSTMSFTIPTNADFTKTLSGINVDNLASIVSSVQKNSQVQPKITGTTTTTTSADRMQNTIPSHSAGGFNNPSRPSFTPSGGGPRLNLLPRPSLGSRNPQFNPQQQQGQFPGQRQHPPPRPFNQNFAPPRYNQARQGFNNNNSGRW